MMSWLVSMCPYIIVAVVLNPTLCAASWISVHCCQVSFGANLETTFFTESLSISEPPPGIVRCPASHRSCMTCMGALPDTSHICHISGADQ